METLKPSKYQITMHIMKYETTRAIVFVLAMIIGTKIAFGETKGSDPQRKQMLCKKKDIIKLFYEFSELKEEMVSIRKSVNDLKKDELGELKQNMADIKETMDDIKKAILESKKPIQVPPHVDMMVCSGNRSFKTGVRTIKLQGQNASKVYCSGGCVFMARRFDGSVDFFRGWTEYQSGFGNPAGEHFIGLDNLHHLVKQGKYKLRIDLTTWPPKSETRHAEYSIFNVSDERDNYRLSIGGFTGNAGDSLAYQNGMPFSTKDRVNNKSDLGNCAANYKGAWWYNSCLHSNLFGFYSNKAKCRDHAACVVWWQWPNEIGKPDNMYYSFKKIDMKLCPK